ncbi:MAG TPA: hypothetical protein DGN59_09230, partial [Candidatus Latescibacteria bacterium]|nr:hypothetical protein [Candidatus Latescibacterota bacterium]
MWRPDRTGASSGHHLATASLLALLLAPSVARATANRADSATNPQPLMDLQSLIAATAAGDTLLLEAGRYAPATI